VSSPKPNPFRLQFGLSAILLLTTGVAIYLVLWPVEIEPVKKSLVDIENLENWGSLTGTKGAWRVDQQGHLIATKRDVDVYFKTEFPDIVQIELELEYDRELNMVFGLGVPKDQDAARDLPKLETWEDSLVFSQVNSFSILYESLQPPVNANGWKELSFLIVWDRVGKRVTIKDSKTDKVLAETSLQSPKTRRNKSNRVYQSNFSSGIYIESKNGDLSITKLMVTEYLSDGDGEGSKTPSKPN
jgi:hypothetical protein